MVPYKVNLSTPCLHRGNSKYVETTRNQVDDTNFRDHVFTEKLFFNDFRVESDFRSRDRIYKRQHNVEKKVDQGRDIDNQ